MFGEFRLRGALSNRSIAQWLAYLLPDPATPGLIPSIPEIFFEEEKLSDVAAVNQRHCFEESGRLLENVD